MSSPKRGLTNGTAWGEAAAEKALRKRAAIRGEQKTRGGDCEKNVSEFHGSKSPFDWPVARGDAPRINAS